MKKTVTSSVLAIAAIFALYAFSPSAADVFKVDTSKSRISWTGQNVAGGKHTGTINISKGELAAVGGTLTGGSFTAAINSIAVTDLEGGRATKLADHLKSEDFFDAPKFPEATFKITKVGGSGSDATITGDLTIKGITKSITFPAVVHQSASGVHATATGIKIDRTKFDIKYRSGNFFSDLGDRAISDEFLLAIEIVAAK
ncbi:YceI family protein [Parapedobacter sp. DT-150]|uniref:YceI family protein n=1 Tax=Parapedobacter sp. DT-150 TaxID=3396162 RepID=UPI003F1B21CE